MTTRRDEIFGLMVEAQARRVRQRRRARAGVLAIVFAASLMPAIFIAFVAPLGPPRIARVEHESGEDRDGSPWAQAETSGEHRIAAAVPGRTVILPAGLKPQRTVVEVSPPPRVEHLNDEDLSRALASMGREPGLVRSGGRVILASSVGLPVRTP